MELGGLVEPEAAVERERGGKRGLEVTDEALLVCLLERWRQEHAAETLALVVWIDSDKCEVPVRLCRMALSEGAEAGIQPRRCAWEQRTYLKCGKRGTQARAKAWRPRLRGLPGRDTNESPVVGFHGEQGSGVGELVENRTEEERKRQPPAPSSVEAVPDERIGCERVGEQERRASDLTATEQSNDRVHRDVFLSPPAYPSQTRPWCKERRLRQSSGLFPEHRWSVPPCAGV